jgi:hypothetical protein
MDRAGLTHSWNGRLIRENAAVRGRLQWSRVGSYGDTSGPHFPGMFLACEPSSSGTLAPEDRVHA